MKSEPSQTRSRNLRETQQNPPEAGRHNCWLTWFVVACLVGTWVLLPGRPLSAVVLPYDTSSLSGQDKKQDPPKQQDAVKKQQGQKQDKKQKEKSKEGGNKQGTKQQGDADKDARQKQLDKDLFDDLGGGLFDDLTKQQDNKGVQAAKSDLFDDLGDGEDIGKASNPLVRIGQQMRAVENLLKGAEGGQSTQELQQRITADLDRLIAQAEQQQQSQNSQNQNNNSSQANNSQPGANNQQPGQADGNLQQSGAQSQSPGQAPQTSSDHSRPPAGSNSASMAAIRDLLEKTPWGDLPQRVRETMLQSPTEQMLPEYADQIREYFKQLAKRRGRRP
ncbi:MAG: hypothetical protein MPJ50_13075 [Pirellulales bacterium]|nr:hypothetical protein [Pirellulales bacterium]